LDNSIENKHSLLKGMNPDRALIMRGRLIVIVMLIAMATVQSFTLIHHWIVCCFWLPFLWPAVIACVTAMGYFYGITWAKWVLVATSIWLSVQFAQDIIVMQQGFVEWHTWLFTGFNLFINMFILYAIFINKSTRAFTAEQRSFYE